MCQQRLLNNIYINVKIKSFMSTCLLQKKKHEKKRTLDVSSSIFTFKDNIIFTLYLLNILGRYIHCIVHLKGKKKKNYP